MLSEDVAIEAPALSSASSESEGGITTRHLLLPFPRDIETVRAPSMFYKAHSLRLGQGRVVAARKQDCSVYVDHASHPSINTPKKYLVPRQEQDSDDSDEEWEDERGKRIEIPLIEDELL